MLIPRVDVQQNVSFTPPVSDPEESAPVWLHLCLLLISSQVTVGLAKIFDLEVLMHGSSFTNCYGILKNGGDPSKGGNENGSTLISNQLMSDNRELPKNHFYVFKDTEIRHNPRQECETVVNAEGKEITILKEIKDSGDEPSILKKILTPYVFARFHAVLSGISHIHSYNLPCKIIQGIFFGFINLFSPTLRFIYTLQEARTIFEGDPEYGGLAYMTTHKLPNSRIGLIGVYNQMSMEGLSRGIQERPWRVAAGVVQLIAGSLITSTGFGYLL